MVDLKMVPDRPKKGTWDLVCPDCGNVVSDYTTRFEKEFGSSERTLQCPNCRVYIGKWVALTKEATGNPVPKSEFDESEVIEILDDFYRSSSFSMTARGDEVEDQLEKLGLKRKLRAFS